jgi:hypothetical protein
VNCIGVRRRARAGIDADGGFPKEGRRDSARQGLAARVEDANKCGAIFAVAMTRMGVRVLEYHVVSEAVEVVDVPIGTIDQRVRFVPFDVVDECLNGGFGCRDLVLPDPERHRLGDEAFGAGAGTAALIGRSRSRFSEPFQTVKIMGPDVGAGVVELGRLAEAPMFQPKMGPAGSGREAESDRRADPVVEVLKARGFWTGRVDAAPLHQILRIPHDAHGRVEARGWKAEFARSAHVTVDQRVGRPPGIAALGDQFPQRVRRGRDLKFVNKIGHVSSPTAWRHSSWARRGRILGTTHIGKFTPL